MTAAPRLAALHSERAQSAVALAAGRRTQLGPTRLASHMGASENQGPFLGVPIVKLIVY